MYPCEYVSIMGVYVLNVCSATKLHLALFCMLFTVYKQLSTAAPPVTRREVGELRGAFAHLRTEWPVVTCGGEHTSCWIASVLVSTASPLPLSPAGLVLFSFPSFHPRHVFSN